MADRVSTLDVGYETGQLSLFPEAVDTAEQLYEVRNNADTELTQGVPYGGRYLVVESTSAFPPKGLILVGSEIVYYDKKTANTFQDLKRGFAGSRQNQWPVGTKVVNSVMAETHNAVKDAVINTQTKVGTSVSPAPTSLNGRLNDLENRFLAPKPIFRAEPARGPAPLAVKFQEFTSGDPVRFLWDFGDGSTSVEEAPTHTYLQEGDYTVRLNIVTTLGAQGVATKEDYITVDNSLHEGFYYVTPAAGSVGTTFTFVDQTTGDDISSRYWIFDDGQKESQLDPDIHVTTHVYTTAGVYNTALIVVFSDQSIKRYMIDPIVVS